MNNKRNRTEESLNCMDCNIGDIITYPTSTLEYLIIDKSKTLLKLVSKRQRYRHQELHKSFYRIFKNSSGVLPLSFEISEYQLLLEDGRKWLNEEIKGTMNIK